jgi:Cysteinyl-tRNA synthetase
MAFATLGKQIDIHTGGEDLQYTHHNAEIAQAEALTKKPYVSHWVHNAHVLIGTEKIAKSGTSLRLADITAEGYHPLALRYLYLMSSYRHPLSFSFESLSAANEALTRLWRFFYERPEQMIAGSIITPVYDAVSSALADDLDTPQALAHIATFLKDTAYNDDDKRATLIHIDDLLGLGLDKSVAEGAALLGTVDTNALPPTVRDLAAKRETARAKNDYAASDRYRDEIRTHGFIVSDTPHGQRFTRTTP